MIDAERIDFIAVPVSDLGRADDFYGRTLGLARNEHSSGERWVEYETGNLTIALSMYGGSVALRVPDVPEARGVLEEDGLQFAMDTFDSGVCHGAPFLDPDGNPLQLHRRYAPLEDFPVPEQEVLRTDFIGVNVTDRAAASDFYGRRLGLEYKPEFGIALRVADVGQSMERLQSAGVDFAFPEPYDSGVCHMAFFADPDGNGLILHHRYAPYADGSKP